MLLAALDARRPRPWRALLSLFLWGAVVAAFCAARMNDLVAAGLAGSTGEAQARVLVATAGAPVIEEVLTAGLVLMLAVRPALLRSARDGIVNGAWIGLGFDLAENLQYLSLAAVQGGTAGLIRGVWVRGFLGGLKHAVFTGTAGAGLGWARDARTPRARVFVPACALLAAIAQHAAWNAVASGPSRRRCAAPPRRTPRCRATPARSRAVRQRAMIVVLFVGPGALALLAIAWRDAVPRSH
jgi:RsiW-degrading membrane proteinase PrsW (M82 family)